MSCFYSQLHSVTFTIDLSGLHASGDPHPDPGHELSNACQNWHLDIWLSQKSEVDWLKHLQWEHWPWSDCVTFNVTDWLTDLLSWWPVLQSYSGFATYLQVGGQSRCQQDPVWCSDYSTQSCGMMNRYMLNFGLMFNKKLIHTGRRFADQSDFTCVTASLWWFQACWLTRGSEKQDLTSEKGP